MAEITDLLKLWHNRRRSSTEVQRIAMKHLPDLDQRMAEMEAMKRTLQHLVDCWRGDHRPNCPILDELGKAGAPAASPAKPPDSSTFTISCAL